MSSGNFLGTPLWPKPDMSRRLLSLVAVNEGCGYWKCVAWCITGSGVEEGAQGSPLAVT